MRVEITGYSLEKGYLIIYATNLDSFEENVIERGRDDHPQDYEVEFHFDTTEPEVQGYVRKWLHRQKITKGCKTFGEALRAVTGTVTTMNTYYLYSGVA